MTNNKITPDHLARSAYVYVRQSTPDQLLNNPESRRRQYALTMRARALGWENVIIIDDDLGRSGSGTARPGFERLLAAICTGTAGAVFALEASRLARNGRDWHTLLEFCSLVNSLIIDEDGVYDPSCWCPYSIVRCVISRCFRMPDLSAFDSRSGFFDVREQETLGASVAMDLIAPLRMERLIQ